MNRTHPFAFYKQSRTDPSGLSHKNVQTPSWSVDENDGGDKGEVVAMMMGRGVRRLWWRLMMMKVVVLWQRRSSDGVGMAVVARDVDGGSMMLMGVSAGGGRGGDV
ncbi:hypothetical protein Tco_1116591 [Tanacetum coccineum]